MEFLFGDIVLTKKDCQLFSLFLCSQGTVEPVELVYPASPSPCYAPVATLSAVTTPTVTITIPLNVVGVFDRNEGLGAAGKVMIEGACRQLLHCADKLRVS